MKLSYPLYRKVTFMIKNECLLLHSYDMDIFQYAITTEISMKWADFLSYIPILCNSAFEIIVL